LIIFSNIITPRLQYIAGFISKEISGTAAIITSDAEAFKNYSGVRINYSTAPVSNEEIHIKPVTLLFENDIKAQQTECTTWKDIPVFFRTDADFPFDVFAASFFLLSRYEEYLPHKKDMYGRYAHENSLAYLQGFLNKPLINIWLQEFREILKNKFPDFQSLQPPLTFLPTYDIDMAWSYQNKASWRNAGGVVKSFLSGNWTSMIERVSVLMNKEKDPFDAYGWLNALHERYKLRPYYFFLLAKKTGSYDKNISPDSEAMRSLIHDHAIRYPIGIHPSWQSGDKKELLADEIKALKSVTGADVVSSRQHYIRFTLPQTFRDLLDNGIRFDFSMGYGSINGFRASVCSPFYWYDLPNEKQTELMLFPFCFMEANSFYEQKFTARQALDEMHYYYKEVKATGGTFIMIWHNTFLGTDKSFKGWRESYEQFIKEISS